MANLADRIATGTLIASIEMVLSSREDVPGIRRAKERGLPVLVLPRRLFVRGDVFDVVAFTSMATRVLEPLDVDLIALAGFMSKLDPALMDRYPVVNVHPALLPNHGGPGMYGHHVHQAVLAAGEPETGCTVHFVDPEYDAGPIIAQMRVPVLEGDTPDSLAERVQQAERQLYPEVIGAIAAGRVRVEKGLVIVRPHPRVGA